MWVIYPFDPERRVWSHPHLEPDAQQRALPQHDPLMPWEQQYPAQHSRNGSFTSPDLGRDRWNDPYKPYSPRTEHGNQTRESFSTKPHSRKPCYLNQYGHHPSHAQHVSFEQASTALYEALEAASRGCQKLETSFQQCTRGLTSWLRSRDIDSLWTIYMDWDGKPVERILEAEDLPSETDPEVHTYVDIQRRLLRALSAAFTCAETPAKLGPRMDTTGAYATPSWQILRTTTRKLRISLEAIEELLGMLLESIRPLWDMPSKAGSAFTTPPKEEPFEPRQSREK
ncbi:hypothetical protein CLAFUW4_08844 [Fulvia fulva]|uniref:Uncharacterized protein n=1 Tax=Passalora fulva TaxID=5499 RepID=A0A9Q8PGG1_PASFU|nr:uncharacterized protein CLAFUR5_08950 [Fulvia fulva]KAK4613545.1 hypothetical protein CLAFUR4_08850 [Fulvia fulva]KAK4615082.1 hypothetical protein CLAFUR0_08842 [Fulvia fulva]UJO21976.1 hypothetical protein CLAFUR5_08950 [Fulvia fulva]WPV20673.1 hypothetical protein CLAFUW4_08844 [Fulvia fulva]WPV35430.1 hypothetical protein CLAFUW7_08845 [Fulvia fulva]